MAAQLPVPNAANMQTAVNGMATHGNNIVQEIQAYHTHQQQLATEMTLCGNYNVTTIQQQVAQNQQQITALTQTVAQTQQQIAQNQQQITQNQQQITQNQQQITALTQTVAQTQQQITQNQQQITALTQTVAQTQQQVNQQGPMMSAQFWNLNAKIQNSKVHQRTGTLVAMRSIDSSPNPRIPINQPILNFPGAPNDILPMNGGQCRDILVSLDAPIPQGHVRTRDLQSLVREAIGLSAI